MLDTFRNPSRQKNIDSQFCASRRQAAEKHPATKQVVIAAEVNGTECATAQFNVKTAYIYLNDSADH